MVYLYYVLLGVCSYFIGNISFARILSHAFHKDITKSGSGNPGTLNMWRSCGFWPGIATFVLDMLKGLIPCLIAYFCFGHLGCNPEIAVYVAGFSVILGHIFPVLFKFKGGKGIATAIGVFLVANWWLALISFVVMVVCMLFIKYASIFTIGFVMVCSIGELILCDPANWVNYIFICAILTLVLIAHRANIKRLFTGKENKTELLAMVKGLFKKKNKSNENEPVNNNETIVINETSTNENKVEDKN